MRSWSFANDVGYPCTLSSTLKELENLHYCAGVICKCFSGCANSAGNFKFNTLYCLSCWKGIFLFQEGCCRNLWSLQTGTLLGVVHALWTISSVELSSACWTCMNHHSGRPSNLPAAFPAIWSLLQRRCCFWPPCRVRLIPAWRFAPLSATSRATSGSVGPRGGAYQAICCTEAPNCRGMKLLWFLQASSWRSFQCDSVIQCQQNWFSHVLTCSHENQSYSILFTWSAATKTASPGLHTTCGTRTSLICSGKWVQERWFPKQEVPVIATWSMDRDWAEIIDH